MSAKWTCEVDADGSTVELEVIRRPDGRLAALPIGQPYADAVADGDDAEDLVNGLHDAGLTVTAG